MILKGDAKIAAANHYPVEFDGAALSRILYAEGWLDGARAAAESRDQRIKRLEEAADFVLEADALAAHPWSPAWLGAIETLKDALG